MYMKRLIHNWFANWANRADRSPLIVRGARQIGKTYAIRDFAKEHFEHFIEINLEENPQYIELLSSPAIQQTLEELSVLSDTPIIEGKTLLFLDEIQVAPKVISNLRYFKEKAPNLHVITAGSLLDHALNKLSYSMPVGRVEFCHMYPMTFKEVLLAKQEIKLVEYIESYQLGDTFSKLIHKKLMDLLRQYTYIGGMPRAVAQWLTNNPLQEVERIHNDLLLAFQYDFAKYGNKTQQLYLKDVLDYVAQHSGQKTIYAHINPHVRSSVLKESLQLLQLSRLVHPITHSNARNVPITSLQDTHTFKSLLFDIGLSNHLNRIELIQLQDLVTDHKGAIAEQFIGQSLLASQQPYEDTQLFYWTRQAKNSNAEVDYIWQHQNKLYPIEVKAGKSGTLKSMHVYLYEKGLETGIRFNADLPSIAKCTAQVRANKTQASLSYQLISLPLYLSSEINRLL